MSASIYDAPDLYDLLFESFDFDLPFWREVAWGAGGPMLDVGCGTGRVLLPLVAEGVDIDGLDASAAMIERLRAKAAARGLTVQAEVAQMERFTSPRRYARVICAFNSFAHAATTDLQIAALTCMHDALRPGGALVLHMSYPSARFWSEPDGAAVMEIEITLPSGNRLQLWDTRTKDPVNQSQQSSNEYRELDASGAIVRSHVGLSTQRWVYRFELELLLRAAGFLRSQVFGGFEREPLARDDQQMICWAWKA